MQTAERAYDEIIDLFARGSTANEIVGFRPSARSQRRVRDLLARNRRGELTAEESVELERLGEFEHLMQLVKARARLYTEASS
jgi:hypothetical protein